MSRPLWPFSIKSGQLWHDRVCYVRFMFYVMYACVLCMYVCNACAHVMLCMYVMLCMFILLCVDVMECMYVCS